MVCKNTLTTKSKIKHTILGDRWWCSLPITALQPNSYKYAAVDIGVVKSMTWQCSVATNTANVEICLATVVRACVCSLSSHLLLSFIEIASLYFNVPLYK